MGKKKKHRPQRWSDHPADESPDFDFEDLALEEGMGRPEGERHSFDGDPYSDDDEYGELDEQDVPSDFDGEWDDPFAPPAKGGRGRRGKTKKGPSRSSRNPRLPLDPDSDDAYDL